MNSSDGGAAQRPRSGPRATYPEHSATAQTRRRWFVALSILVVVAGVTLAAIGYSKFGTADVSGEATGYEILDDSTVAVQFTVDRSDPSKPAACVVRGRSRDGSETGRSHHKAIEALAQEGRLPLQLVEVVSTERFCARRERASKPGSLATRVSIFFGCPK